MISCIYQIKNTVNSKIYIGSTKNFKSRKNEHLSSLRSGKHHCIYLQRSYEKYGKNNFIFEILEECDIKCLLEKEIFWIEKLKPEYNIGSVGGGDNYTNHPNKEERYITLCKQLRNCKRPEPLFKENNPNWKGGKTFFICPVCGKEIRVTGERINQKTCGKCSTRAGENNTFYGKKHSEESKEKIRQSKIGKKQLQCAKKCCINNVIFESCSDAARKMSIQNKTMSNRLRSKNELFKNYYYIGSDKDPTNTLKPLDTNTTV